MVDNYKYFDTDTSYVTSRMPDIFIKQVNKLPCPEMHTIAYNIPLLFEMSSGVLIVNVKVFNIPDKDGSKISFISEIIGEKNAFTLCINKKQFKTNRLIKLK